MDHGGSSVLKLAIDAQLPIVAVQTRDTLNLPEVVKELTGKKIVALPTNGPYAEKTLFATVFQPGEPMKLQLNLLYEKLTAAESTLLLVNAPQVVEPMFDAGEMPVPKSLLMKFLKAVVENEKRAEELTRGLGGCTIKEAAELCRLTMARDNSLTVPGLMQTRKSSFQGNRGLAQVDTKQVFYDPPPALVKWVKLEKSFFLTGSDLRLIPRGLLFDGLPGTGKTAGAKWVAEQLGVPLYRVDIGGTKNKYVGQSEQNMLLNLARLDGEEPCVCLIDEVEKVFSTDIHDTSGTTATMMSQLLWWMAEHKSRLLTVMTTNNAKLLPRELYREGRIDEVMWFSGLEKVEAKDFAAAVLATFPKVKAKFSPVELSFATDTIVAKAMATIKDAADKRVSQAALTKAVHEFIKSNANKLAPA
jgi:hypothetical protein